MIAAGFSRRLAGVERDGAAESPRFRSVHDRAHSALVVSPRSRWNASAITHKRHAIVYVEKRKQLFVPCTLDQLESVAITGLVSPRSPFVSPDGQWIGFFEGIGDKLRRVAITGGPAQVLSTFTGQRAGATWSEDGTIVYATTDAASGLWRVSPAAGTPTALTKPNAERGESDHLWPEFLPGGRSGPSSRSLR